MSGDAYLRLLSIVAYSCVLNTEAYSGGFPLTLPDWRSNADYFAKCDIGSDLPASCDWTSEGPISAQTATEETSLHPESPSGVFRLKSGFLKISEDSCLEFWYHKPNKKISELKVLLEGDILQTLIWTSETSSTGDWRQVFIPLTKQSDKDNIQVVFELLKALQDDEQTAFDRIGIRKGQCGPQCQQGGTFWTDKSTRCTCTEEQLICSHIPRSKDTFGTCHVASDPYYTTFDGVSFQFESPCTYLLSKVCDDSGLLPEFAVEVQNENKGDSHISSIQKVNINVHGLRVTMVRTERSKVMVNGIWKNLPLHLQGNRVTVNAQGDALVLQTDFKLSIFYLRSGAIQVIVPSQYSNRICGMCGNFNHETEDDFKIPDGYLVQDTHVLGQSMCGEPTLLSVCTDAEEQKYASEVYCGILTSRQGLFSTCSSVLNADSFFRSCMFDMCTTHGDPAALCNAIEAFSATCDKVGISVLAWRNTTFCPVACGPHSHYNSCTSGCPKTCSSQDATGSCGICEESCECDDGFMLSGGACVLAEDCGCWANGQHYLIRETFMEGECEQQCQCLGNGKIQCSPTSCKTDEVCMVKDGVLGCFPSSPVTCSAYGDPHYITFDGKAYSFWGTCNYTIAKTCGATDTQFTITARNEGQNNSATSSLNSVALDMEGLHIVIGKNKQVYANGGQVRLPAEFGSSVSVFQSGPYAQVNTNFGLRLLFGNARLFVQVDERYRGVLCGLCGTYSGSQFDDFLTPEGNTVANPHEFARSWKTNDSDWTCSNGSPDPPECHPDLEDDAYTKCSELFEDAFKECHWFVPPQIYVSSCVSDYCISKGDKAQLCTSLEDYVSACEIAEVFLPDWRNHTLCFADPLPTEDPTPTPSAASCPWSCDFDQDECDWEQLIQDSFDWTRWSGSTPSNFTGPAGDHTTGSGYYMYIEGDSVFYGDSARIMSPVCHTTGKQCLSFWFHMYGMANAMLLNLYIFENNRASKIWSRTNNQGNSWYQGQVEIKPQHPFQIIIEGIRGSNPRSDVSIDDVSIMHGACDHLSAEDLDLTTLAPHPSTPNLNDPHPNCSMNCDFESDICSWTQMVTDVFDWTRHKGSTPTSMTGPSSDHTTGSGFYMYIEGDTALHGDTARLLSAECADPQPQCLQFWYHMYGSSWTMGLSVYLLQHGNVAKEVWGMREDQGNMWHLARVDLRPDVKFQVIFEGRRGSSARSDVAVDDVSLHRGACSDLPNDMASPSVPLTKPLPIQSREIPNALDSCSISCDFERDICAWTQLATDVFDWTRHRGSTPTSMTGPSSDHTTGSGFYMYIEGDSAVHGDTARLLSAECADPQPQCLQFWYHMYGSSWTMGLSVYMLQYGNVAKEVWRMREDQGNMWHLARVDLRPDVKFQVIFEGRRGSSARSDVAIDDVSLHRGACSDLPNQVAPPSVPLPPAATMPQPAPIQTAEIPNTSASCGIDCDFEKDICTWTQLATDVFDWTRHRGSTPTSMTGPSSDHTTGSGFYMYIEGDSAVHGDTARLLSAECADPQPQCLQFWYHMYGSSWTMGLSVYLLQHGNVAKEVWRMREDQGNMWHLARVDLRPDVKFQVIFEGRRGSSARSDVAIDDVSLHRGACSDLPNQVAPPSIPLPQPAPIQHREIPNASASCSISCDFERDICTWTQLVTDVFDWTRHRGSTPTSMTGPSSDHTTGSGFYMYIEGDSAVHGDTARLLSAECADPQPQCLQFWYHMYGSSWTMGLSIYLLQHGNVAKEVWRMREDQGNMWHLARVDLRPDVKFQVIFEGRRGSSARSDVAIDDVSLHRGACSDLPNQVAPPSVPLPPAATMPQPAPIQTAEIPNTSASCGISCDFDRDICAWTQLATDVFDWTRHRGSTPTSMSGPSSDHTTGSGFYMYIEGDSAVHGDTARLLSAECADPQPQCLQFWYHMYGSSWTMGLSVYLLQYGNVAKEVWRMREDQGNMWHLARVDLRPDVKFQVIFEGRRGSSARTDVAIDDVSLHRGACSEITLSDTYGNSDSIRENNMMKSNEEVAKKESWKPTDDKITARRRRSLLFRERSRA
ncbi:MAM and LDL-receptor class A domain-containing protein 1-like isoform X2 [Cyprinus carpio]|uniref:MAM and LDL-receptor class A domain-containing protein 1-like isoform X2 n=1 Tax=Cyprinus carpio TaxID=7962 RepID=A0A9Q9ZUZ9_CYPCA|nr:MAM and LDL-receptor class A domain-containing protein 1-like isoform X2 [Cyprinus carpio]